MVKKTLCFVAFSFVCVGFLIAGEQVLTQFVPKENYFLPIGSRIDVTTENTIFSFNLEVPVIANVDQPVICPKNGVTVLPKGTKLIGSVAVLKSDNRVNVHFYQAVLPKPSGKEFAISGLALSSDGSSGLVGLVKEYKEVRLMSSAASGAFSSVGQAVSATAARQPLAVNAIGGALSGGSQVVAENAQTKVDVSIEVKPYVKCQVILLDRLILDSEQPAVVKEPKIPKDELEEIEYQGKK